jgi:glycosyltransferase involved in cell wall biosynthesis
MNENISALVGVIIPTYNRAHMVRRAIDSVLAQTLNDFVVVVVDDGSNDGTESVISSYNDRRIVYLRHEQNLGCSAARNTGIDFILPRVKFICFLDSDDLLLPEKFERETALLEQNPEAGFTYSPYIICDEIRNIEYIGYPAAAGRPDDFAREHFLTNEAKPAAIMYRAAALKENRFDTCLTHGEDFDFLQKIAIKECCVYSEYLGVVVFFHAGSISSNWLNLSISLLRASENMLRAYPNFADLLGKEARQRIIFLKRQVFISYLAIGQYKEAKEFAQGRLDCFALRFRCRKYGLLRRIASEILRFLRIRKAHPSTIKEKLSPEMRKFLSCNTWRGTK